MFKKILIGVVSILFLAGVGLGFANHTSANPAEYCINSTADSTSTVVAMSAGAATTTLTLTNCASSPTTDGAYVQFQYLVTSASNTAKLVARVEHSQNKVDWYSESNPVTSLATSTVLSGDSASFFFNLASTTDAGGSGTVQRLHRAFSINTPTKYTRVIFTVPQSGGTGSLYAEAVGKNQY